jgi:hypothetical protein
MTILRFVPAHKDMWRLLRRAPRDSGTGCFIWQGHRLPAGYGTYNWPSGRGLVHRRSHTLFNGPIPPSYEVDHRCRECTRLANRASSAARRTRKAAAR